MKTNTNVQSATLLLGAAGLFFLPIGSFGLGLVNDTYALPAGLANDVVRVQVSAGSGTGTILSAVSDGSGGYWYNVLTADHVTTGTAFINIGFRFDTGYPAGFSVPNLAQNLVSDAANGPDLSLFAVDVTAAVLGNLPVNGLAPSSLLQPVSLMAADNSANNLIVQAGFGNTATLVAGGYQENAGTYGTYNAGGNTIPANGPGAIAGQGNQGIVAGYTRGIYTFTAVRGTFAVTANPTVGTTYLLSGDSGGPTFEANGSGGFSLVGVHSASFNNNPNPAGSLWTDVDLTAGVQNWINTEIPLIDVPEPTTLALAGLGGLAALVVARRRK
jgi:hypothetical protein